MKVLSPTEISKELAAHPGWHLAGNEIVRTFEFPDFIKAVTFVDSVAVLAEQAGHHPDIDIRYNKIKLALSTHDAGGITTKDFALAAEIDSIG